MSNAVFPVLAGLGWSVIKRPIFRTITQSAVSGKEIRAAMMSYPLYQIEMTYEILRAAAAYQELQQLIGFFNARNGSFDSFLYTDPNDNSVTAQKFGVGNGVATAFQLVRAYGGFVETVQNLNGIPLIYINGVQTTLFSIGSTGIVTFNTAPANGAVLTWTGSFYFRVKFVEDQVDFENFMYQLWQLKKITLQTIKQ